METNTNKKSLTTKTHTKTTQDIDNDTREQFLKMLQKVGLEKMGALMQQAKEDDCRKQKNVKKNLKSNVFKTYISPKEKPIEVKTSKIQKNELIKKINQIQKLKVVPQGFINEENWQKQEKIPEVFNINPPDNDEIKKIIEEDNIKIENDIKKIEEHENFIKLEKEKALTNKYKRKKHLVECPTCKKQYERSKLNRHIQQVHSKVSNNKIFRIYVHCKLCDKPVLKYRYGIHYNECIKIEKDVCLICGNIYGSRVLMDDIDWRKRHRCHRKKSKKTIKQLTKKPEKKYHRKYIKSLKYNKPIRFRRRIPKLVPIPFENEYYPIPKSPSTPIPIGTMLKALKEEINKLTQLNYTDEMAMEDSKINTNGDIGVIEKLMSGQEQFSLDFNEYDPLKTCIGQITAGTHPTMKCPACNYCPSILIMNREYIKNINNLLKKRIENAKSDYEKRKIKFEAINDLYVTEEFKYQMYNIEIKKAIELNYNEIINKYENIIKNEFKEENKNIVRLTLMRSTKIFSLENIAMKISIDKLNFLGKEYFDNELDEIEELKNVNFENYGEKFYHYACREIEKTIMDDEEEEPLTKFEKILNYNGISYEMFWNKNPGPQIPGKQNEILLNPKNYFGYTFAEKIYTVKRPNRSPYIPPYLAPIKALKYYETKIIIEDKKRIENTI